MRSFLRFLSIRGLRKLVFSVFCSSEGSESLFFVFSTHPRPRKGCFWQFLLSRGLGWVVFHSAAAMKEKNVLLYFDLGKYKIHKIKKSFMRLKP